MLFYIILLHSITCLCKSFLVITNLFSLLPFCVFVHYLIIHHYHYLTIVLSLYLSFVIEHTSPYLSLSFYVHFISVEFFLKSF